MQPAFIAIIGAFTYPEHIVGSRIVAIVSTKFKRPEALKLDIARAFAVGRIRASELAVEPREYTGACREGILAVIMILRTVVLAMTNNRWWYYRRSGRYV